MSKKKYTQVFDGEQSASPQQKHDAAISLAKSVLTETFATTIFIFVTCSAMFLVSDDVSKGLVVAITAYGLVWGLDRNTGGFNPAITITLLIFRSFSFMRAAAYIVGQLIGMTIAGALLFGFFSDLHEDLATPVVDSLFGVEKAFFLETFWSFMIVLLALIRNKLNFKPAGLEPYATFILVPIALSNKLTGASFNPLRYFAPAMFSEVTSLWWLYLVTPFIGAVLAGLAFAVYRVGMPTHDEHKHNQHHHHHKKLSPGVMTAIPF